MLRFSSGALCFFDPILHYPPPLPSVISHVLEAVWVNACKLQVTLANAFEAQMGRPARRVPSANSIQNVFGDSPRVHFLHVAKPSQTSLTEKTEHAGDACTIKDLSVCHSILPLDVQYAPEAVEVEAVQCLLLCGICRPGFTTVQEGAEDTRLVHFQFCHLGQAAIGPDSLVQLSQGG